MNSTVEVKLEKLPIGEVIKDGDYWYYSAIQQYIRFDDAPRNFFGLREKVAKHHAPIFRIPKTLKK